MGYAIVIHKGSCQIHELKEGLIVDVKMYGNHMFHQKNQNISRSYLSQNIFFDPSWLWHYIFGHWNLNRLKDLHKKKWWKGFSNMCDPMNPTFNSNKMYFLK